jgi:hypothetical protein
MQPGVAVDLRGGGFVGRAREGRGGAVTGFDDQEVLIDERLRDAGVDLGVGAVATGRVVFASGVYRHTLYWVDKKSVAAAASCGILTKDWPDQYWSSDSESWMGTAQ